MGTAYKILSATPSKIGGGAGLAITAWSAGDPVSFQHAWGWAVTPEHIRMVTIPCVALFLIYWLILWLLPKEPGSKTKTSVHANSVGNLVMGNAAFHTTTNPGTSRILMAHYKEIDSFICHKAEMEIRHLFQFDEILNYNAMHVALHLFNDVADPSIASEIDAFFEGGQSQADVRYIGISVGPDGVVFHPKPNEIGMITLSKTFFESLGKIQKFVTSALTPEAVKVELRELEATVGKNIALIHDVLTEAVQQNPAAILAKTIPGHPKRGRLTNTFAVRFVQLRPVVDRLAAALKNEMKIG